MLAFSSLVEHLIIPERCITSFSFRSPVLPYEDVIGLSVELYSDIYYILLFFRTLIAIYE